MFEVYALLEAPETSVSEAATSTSQAKNETTCSKVENQSVEPAQPVLVSRTQEVQVAMKTLNVVVFCFNVCSSLDRSSSTGAAPQAADSLRGAGCYGNDQRKRCRHHLR